MFLYENPSDPQCGIIGVLWSHFCFSGSLLETGKDEMLQNHR